MSQQGEPNELERMPFCFTLTLSARELTDQISKAIYDLDASDIDDALVGEADGAVFVDFVVQGTCLPDAIFGMIALIEKALPGINVTKVHPPGEDAIADVNAWLRMRYNPLKNHVFF